MSDRCTVLVCTRNRSGAIVRSLQSIREAAHGAGALTVDLVVVDNASTDDTAQVVQRWAEAQTDLPITLLTEHRKGLSAARNAGLRRAVGDIIVFTDDDCVLSPDYFRHLAAHYRSDRGPVVRGGRVELGDPLDLPFTIKTDDDVQRAATAHEIPGFVHGCNMTMNRAAFERIGFFDERFGAGTRMRSGEDTDYLYRAFLAGVVVEYVPDMTVFHHHGRRDAQSIRQLMHGYHFGNGAIYARYLFRHPAIARHVLWDTRSLIQSRFKIEAREASYGIDFWSKLRGNLSGALSFWTRRRRLGNR